MDNLFCLIFCAKIMVTKYDNTTAQNQSQPVSSVVESKPTPKVVPTTKVASKDNRATVSNNNLTKVRDTVYSYPTVTITATNKPVLDLIPKYALGEVREATELWRRESSLEPCKINGGAINCNYQGNRACGLVQSLPCTKLTSKCQLTDAECQLQWGTQYVQRRYGNFANALAFHNENGWY